MPNQRDYEVKLRFPSNTHKPGDTPMTKQQFDNLFTSKYDQLTSIAKRHSKVGTMIEPDEIVNELYAKSIESGRYIEVPHSEVDFMKYMTAAIHNGAIDAMRQPKEVPFSQLSKTNEDGTEQEFDVADDGWEGSFELDDSQQTDVSERGLSEGETIVLSLLKEKLSNITIATKLHKSQASIAKIVKSLQNKYKQHHDCAIKTTGNTKTRYKAGRTASETFVISSGNTQATIVDPNTKVYKNIDFNALLAKTKQTLADRVCFTLSSSTEK